MEDAPGARLYLDEDDMHVINKGGTDKTVVMEVREFVGQPFQASNWLDLRIGFFLSLTKAVNDDDPTGLAEVIGTPPRPLLGWNDRYRIGLTDRLSGTTFLGFTNRSTFRDLTPGTSNLVSSDAGIGTSNAYFWRPKNEIGDYYSAEIVDSGNTLAVSQDGCQIHFAQDPVNAGGYATLLGIRLQRDNATTRAKIITMTLKTAAAHSGDILFSNTPTQLILQTNLQSFPTTVQQLGPVTLSQVPDTIFVYWPFYNSRLRIHCMGIVKAA